MDSRRPALAGILVLDFSTLLPGPLASLMLAEAGAEVTKVERVGTGDEMRSYTPQLAGESANFCLLNRGKSMGTYTKDTISKNEVLDMMAGGAEMQKMIGELEGATI